ncbi:transcriptional regulator protein-like protein [Cellulomonas flavigena DSM 20109]|uniref:Transcriptional regulator protein-like protein n=1 Tax=Cellulomonas flavigena (strain ATCC 482 / DSM 20109 / BCRC 11376 / JCM 18109 / NBRC 3775 / NCIMB 8073 / NRS 134) TaxID=446466 RepID=D5UEV4_CELFN|nr:WYL domain-containing protein [Cellulomonas flavigena]ADG74764.1 transcriptional regulator protein-like protein [Cellulomonas flavigena DSM 20109]
MPERASDRLVRMLGMIAYLERHEDVPVEQVAAQFGVTPEQVMADVDTLWVTGTPGYLPDDLIDFDASSYERGVVRLTEGRGVTRPLRLGPREGVALLAALRALAALRPALDAEGAAALDSALAKVQAATGDAAAGAPVDVELQVDAVPSVAAALGAALARRRRLRLRYADASDVLTEREVDPVRLVSQDEHSYLLAWSLAADAERKFRVDRIVEATVLDDPAEDHPVTDDADVFHPDASGELVTVRLTGRARWVAETVPVERTRELAGGAFEVDLRVVQPAWLRHLLLQVADEVLDVRPAHVAHDTATAARAALEAYGPLLDATTGES